MFHERIRNSSLPVFSETGFWALPTTEKNPQKTKNSFNKRNCMGMKSKCKNTKKQMGNPSKFVFS